MAMSPRPSKLKGKSAACKNHRNRTYRFNAQMRPTNTNISHIPVPSVFEPSACDHWLIFVHVVLVIYFSCSRGWSRMCEPRPLVRISEAIVTDWRQQLRLLTGAQESCNSVEGSHRKDT
eukprot:GHUV01034786.1.p1 GENE.GHUV01034786.1~~GHUV01034786.1.p1  ORF type:complete len:119 (-),score=14.28 GHUV01034786.1:403-759(-)